MSTVEADVVYQPIEDVEPHPDNPKAHDLDVLTASIRRFGFAEPVVVDQRTGLNLSGHGRIEALRQLRHDDGWDHPPDGIRVDEQGHWLVPVYVGWRSRTDDEARGALIALNRSGERGGWHENSLLDLLDRLAELDDGLDGVGWADDEIAELRARLGEYAPDFDPLDDPDSQPRLDERNPVECGACGAWIDPRSGAPTQAE